MKAYIVLRIMGRKFIHTSIDNYIVWTMLLSTLEHGLSVWNLYDKCEEAVAYHEDKLEPQNLIISQSFDWPVCHASAIKSERNYKKLAVSFL
jgi:hypothetical protein